MAALAISRASGEDLETLLKQKDPMEILRHIRSHQLREPHLVLHYGKALLFDSSTAATVWGTPTGTERLAILEQMFLAALDVHNEELANQCLSRTHHYLRSTVGEDSSSARIRRLEALQKESMEDYNGALEIYDALLDENPANSTCYQRKYAIFKAQVGKEVEAMEALNSYLSKQNQGDAAAWFEMANLCTNVADYKGATYCYEELVLLQPQDASLHCMLGELYLMTGGSSSLLSNLILARKHIALSLELSGDSSSNLRALYALVDATASYLEIVETSNNNTKKAEEKEVQVAKALLQFGVDKILKLYKGTSMFAVVKDVMDGYLELLTQS